MNEAFRLVGCSLLISALAGSIPADDNAAASAGSGPRSPVRVLLLSGQNNHDWRTTTPKMIGQFGQGRSFTLLLGRDVSAMENPGFAALLVRGTEWAATGQVTIDAPREAVGEAAAKPRSQGLSWHREDASVALRCGDQIVWQFNYGKDNDKPCFHPVAIVNGPVLTWDRPEDHVWHRALWFSWKFINGVNYWEPDLQTKQMAGLTEADNVAIETRPDFSARISMNVVYRPAGGKPVLSEDRLVEVSAPDEGGGYTMAWKMKFTAGDQEVVLDRTPLPGEPDGKPYGGYAGLSVRFAKNFREARATSDKGPIEFKDDRYRGRSLAMDYSGVIDGTEAGIAIFDHPANVNSPTPWYVIRSATMMYFSPAVIQDGPRTLKPQEQMALNYRVVVHRRRWNAERLQKAQSDYAAKAIESGRPSADHDRRGQKGTNDKPGDRNEPLPRPRAAKSAAAPVPSKRPNILFVTGDDLGLQLGCYGDRQVHTPNLDTFASQAVRFTNAYVTNSSCSPSRSSLLTGLYPHQNGQIGLAHLGYAMHSDRIPTLPRLLKAAGYRSGIIGKLHVAPESAFPFDFQHTATPDSRDPALVEKYVRDFLGQADDTIVVFVGDNGPPFAGAKSTCSEAGVRVPLLLRWPGRHEAGVTSDALVSTADLMPTLLEVAGAAAPAGLAGASLGPLLHGDRSGWRQTLACEYTTHTPADYNPLRSLRDGRYKLIVSLLRDPSVSKRSEIDGVPLAKAFYRYWANRAVELYDLENDLWEKTNLAESPEHRAVLERLQRALLEWRRATNDPLLDPAAFAALTEEQFRKGQAYMRAATETTFSDGAVRFRLPERPEGAETKSSRAAGINCLWHARVMAAL